MRRNIPIQAIAVIKFKYVVYPSSVLIQYWIYYIILLSRVVNCEEGFLITGRSESENLILDTIKGNSIY